MKHQYVRANPIVEAYQWFYETKFPGRPGFNPPVTWENEWSRYELKLPGGYVILEPGCYIVKESNDSYSVYTKEDFDQHFSYPPEKTEAILDAIYA